MMTRFMPGSRALSRSMSRSIPLSRCAFDSIRLLTGQTHPLEHPPPTPPLASVSITSPSTTILDCSSPWLLPLLCSLCSHRPLPAQRPSQNTLSIFPISMVISDGSTSPSGRLEASHDSPTTSALFSSRVSTTDLLSSPLHSTSTSVPASTTMATRQRDPISLTLRHPSASSSSVSTAASSSTSASSSNHGGATSARRRTLSNRRANFLASSSLSTSAPSSSALSGASSAHGAASAGLTSTTTPLGTAAAGVPPGRKRTRTEATAVDLLHHLPL